jgi:chromosome segregation ATPase
LKNDKARLKSQISAQVVDIQAKAQRILELDGQVKTLQDRLSVDTASFNQERNAWNQERNTWNQERNTWNQERNNWRQLVSCFKDRMERSRLALTRLQGITGQTYDYIEAYNSIAQAWVDEQRFGLSA